ncbi:hypothetical protein PR048_029730 [Dryococelus australis]|uniref:Uncharacterized protein n=1 Tax=Dryococelus australis TaxID=614101 RepID=A0ABQ9GE73_9NEOP|nr:hypothetical protein PR048_029730 [Dryococelus australis]
MLVVVVMAVTAQEAQVRDKRSGILLAGGITPAGTVAIHSPLLPGVAAPWSYPWTGAWAAPWARAWNDGWAGSWAH